MINIDVWKSIIQYISNIKSTNETVGILICGSFARGTLRKGSDIDILFLQQNIDFRMELKPNDFYPIDQLQASPDLLLDILKEDSRLSDTLSLSFGSNQIIIEDTIYMDQILSKAKENIVKRSLTYKVSKEKEPHIIDKAVFTVSKIDSVYRLLCNGDPVI